VIARALENNGKITNQPGAATVADSINVQAPRNSIMAVDYLTKYKGEAVILTDSQIMEAEVKLARNTGVFAEPAASCAYAGFLKLKQTGRISEKRSIVMLTGNGLKDIESAKKAVK
ncbi:MAG: pyridoxal-phosphate dependent enzyme, partial [Candidatus Muiribacteriota bacterium]